VWSKSVELLGGKYLKTKRRDNRAKSVELRSKKYGVAEQKVC